LVVSEISGLPWRLALALQADGWYLRSDLIWHKSDVMAQNVKDRPTRAHEYLFMLVREKGYYYDKSVMLERNGRNMRSVWSVASKGSDGFPAEMIRRCILASTRPHQFVLDPLGVADIQPICDKIGRAHVAIETNNIVE